MLSVAKLSLQNFLSLLYWPLSIYNLDLKVFNHCCHLLPLAHRNQKIVGKLAFSKISGHQNELTKSRVEHTNQIVCCWKACF